MKKLSLFFGLSFLLCACEEHDLGVSKEVLYQKTFEQEFGQIAPGHQWGFDVAEAIINAQNELTRAIIKPDQALPGNLLPYQVFGSVPNITEREHREVFQWFSNHKVNWAITPTWLSNPAQRTTQTVGDRYAYYNGNSYAGYSGDEYEDGCSLLKYPENKCLEEYTIDNLLGFPHAWVQHVANNKENSQYTLDYLQCWGLEKNAQGQQHWQDHLFDGNAEEGWGYGRQQTEHQNGLVVTYADIDLWSYGSSLGHSYPHDKYYIVYLKGDGYEGWYLGFDFESWGDNESEKMPADGICNDWIIKVTDLGNLITTSKFRIMCEDLGGTFDMDFNDIVYDVEYREKICTVTLQAAGGTMPIRLQYGNEILKKNNEYEIHKLFNANQKQPVNVAASNGVDGRNPIVFKIAFSDTQNDFAQNCDIILGIESKEFTLHDLNIYDKQDDIAEWITTENIEGQAPYKFVVPLTDTLIPKWMVELTHISNGYPSFIEWVSDPTVEFWKNPVASDPQTGTRFLY